jgi:hypothetical protein
MALTFPFEASPWVSQLEEPLPVFVDNLQQGIRVPMDDAVGLFRVAASSHRTLSTSQNTTKSQRNWSEDLVSRPKRGNRPKTATVAATRSSRTRGDVRNSGNRSSARGSSGVSPRGKTTGASVCRRRGERNRHLQDRTTAALPEKQLEKLLVLEHLCVSRRRQNRLSNALLGLMLLREVRRHPRD